MRETFLHSYGLLLSATLAGAWRHAPPPVELSEKELTTVAPLLTGSGAAALGWWKLRRTDRRASPSARQLQHAYRFNTLQAALREREIERVFALLSDARIDAVLVKGWAAARLYPEQGLRPFGDMDVCVRPAQFASASRLVGAERRVDLHAGFEKSDERGFDETFERTETVEIGASRVRVLCAEDHLRLLSLHLLRHGAWRPLWLCDVAAAFENRARNFDWTRLLAGDRRRASWVVCALGLAHALVGMRVEDTPVAHEALRLPRWLVPEVLKQWQTPFPARQAPMRHRAPMRKYLRHPSGVFKDLRNRWPNPIEATVLMNASFNELPRLPFQLANCFARTARFISAAGAQTKL
ncbi:MAG TPA: nucleotidyltransferase family protein [Pyrinomonadaceae bacterium]|jgi:hypothetical protein